MGRFTKRIGEPTLNTNLNELAHSLLRELAMACRKASVYGSRHPSASRAIEKPFFVLDQIFGFKKYVNINLQNGNLFILNIRLKDDVFNKEIIKYMQVLDINAILFEKRVTMEELTRFVDRFVRRVDVSDHSNLLGSYLRDNNIDTIEVNSEKGFALFEENKQYRSDIDGDFSIKSMVLHQLGGDLEALAGISLHGEEAALRYGVDYDCEIVKYLIPEIISFLPPSALIDESLEIVRKIEGAEDSAAKDELLGIYKTLYRLVDYHPERRQIYDRLDNSLSADDVPREITEDLRSPAGRIRIESCEQIDELLRAVFVPDFDNLDVEDFSEAFRRLLKTGQQDKCKEVAEHLLDLLSAADSGFRQKSLSLLLDIVKELDLVTDGFVLEALCESTIKKLSGKKETFEYSEFIWQILEKGLKARNYELVAKLVAAIAERRRVERDVTYYDSIAIKKVFDNFDRSGYVRDLIGDLINADFKDSGSIREILVASGSEGVAMELSHIISHPKRQVRQQALRILGELGKASLKVFSQILVDDSVFERESGRHELPDNRWYIIRNSIFVLGLLRDPEATVPLRLRINDNDVRVRREIIRTLEKIGGEEACDILLMMADDPVKEIRESAVITIGLIGAPDQAPLLKDLTQRESPVVLKAISALGKLGGDEAEAFLIELLEDEREFAKLAAGEASKDDIRLAVINALGQIGDNKAIDTIKGYKNNLSATQKIFFKNSRVNRAIEEILSRR